MRRTFKIMLIAGVIAAIGGVIYMAGEALWDKGNAVGPPASAPPPPAVAVKTATCHGRFMAATSVIAIVIAIAARQRRLAVIYNRTPGLAHFAPTMTRVITIVRKGWARPAPWYFTLAV